MDEARKIEYAEIETLLPHRSPFLLIDRLEDILLWESITAIKAVSGNEPYFSGHFPGNPIMPGVLIVEAMAQAAACLARLSFAEEAGNMQVLLTGVNHTKFRKPVIPGDMLKLHVVKIAAKKRLWKFTGVGMVDGRVVNQAEFSAMIVEQDKSGTRI